MDSTYKISNHPMTGDVTWIVEDVDLAVTDGGAGFMEAFIKQYRHNDYTLSIFDSSTNQTVGIMCAVDNMPRIVSYIYHLEHATLSFIGLNSLTESYVVGMSLTRGRIESGVYQDVDGHLKKLTTN